MKINSIGEERVNKLTIGHYLFNLFLDPFSCTFFVDVFSLYGRNILCEFDELVVESQEGIRIVFCSLGGPWMRLLYFLVVFCCEGNHWFLVHRFDIGIYL